MPKPTRFTTPDGTTFETTHKRRGAVQMHYLAYISPMGRRFDTVIFEPDDTDVTEVDMYGQLDGDEEQRVKIDRDEAETVIAFWQIITASYAPKKVTT